MDDARKRKAIKKIALLMNSFWNNGAGMSGGDQRLIQIFKRIGKEFDIDIYTTDDGRKVIDNQITGARYFLSPAKTNRGRLIFSYQKRMKWATGEIIKHKYDIVYGSSDFFPDVIPCRNYIIKNPKTKWVQCIFHVYPNWRTRPGNKIINFLASRSQEKSFNQIKKYARKVININYQVRDHLTKNKGFKEESIIVNPCGVDLEYFSKLKPDADKCDGSFLARLNPSKGIFDLIEIWRKVVDTLPRAKLKIIGGGGETIREKLKKEIENNDLSKNIELCGFLPNDDAYSIIKSSQVFLFPSHEEGFGISLAEAMACGVPAVAWNLPVYDEVFPKGLIQTEIGSFKQFADVIIKLLTEKDFAEKIAKDGSDMVHKYSWDKIANSELKLINAK